MTPDDLGLPFAVTSIRKGPGDPVIVLPGGPCRGPEYLGDLAGVGASRPLIVLHPRGTPQSGGLSRGWWTDANDVILLADALDLGSVDLLALELNATGSQRDMDDYLLDARVAELFG